MLLKPCILSNLVALPSISDKFGSRIDIPRIKHQPLPCFHHLSFEEMMFSYLYYIGHSPIIESLSFLNIVVVVVSRTTT